MGVSSNHPEACFVAFLNYNGHDRYHSSLHILFTAWLMASVLKAPTTKSLLAPLTDLHLYSWVSWPLARRGQHRSRSRRLATPAMSGGILTLVTRARTGQSWLLRDTPLWPHYDHIVASGLQVVTFLFAGIIGNPGPVCNQCITPASGHAEVTPVTILMLHKQKYFI